MEVVLSLLSQIISRFFVGENWKPMDLISVSFDWPSGK
jgi:hypothetical protein